MRTCLILMLFFAACSEEPGPTSNDSADQGSTPDAGSEDLGTISDAADESDARADQRPLIDEVGLCDIPAMPRLSVSSGTDLMKVTLEGENAVCNDGSPAIAYVRPAPEGSVNADRWFIWLEGGGGCNSPSACADRWCGENPLYTAGKMSSRFAPDGIRGTGIFGGRPENTFADWNHVVGYYCSSDNWIGRQRTHAIDESGDTPEYELFLHGAFIVDELVSVLKTGASSDDGSMTLPNVDDAELVVLAGTSAGGGGARFNADRVGEMLRESNADVDYRLVVDAGTFPSDPSPPELTEEDALAILDLKHETITEWRDGVTDASCLEFHADDPRRCADNSHLIFHHITTPWFVKMDLTDNANSPGPYADTQTFARVTFDFYSSIIDGSFTPEEAGVPTDTAGLFLPNCGHHVNLEVSDFYQIRISNGAQELSTHDVLRNWLEGIDPVQAVHDPPNGFTSVCP